MKFNKKILASMLAVGMLFSILLPNAIKANDKEEIITYALTDPAFPDSSKGLNDAIVNKYGTTIDTDNNKTISIAEANAYSGIIGLANQNTGGSTITGIENFTQITALYLYDSDFSGSIPQTIGNMSGLTVLHLYSNQLSGSIPNTVGNLTNLRDFQVHNNQLTGSIPSSLPNLTKLNLGFNQLSGSIPVEIASMTNLQRLVLNDNELTGPIPKELGSIISLDWINVKNNQLSGTIPAELGNLSNLTELYLHENNLTGSIPSDLGNLNNLTNLYLSSNGLTGEIPQELSQLTKLKNLYLYNNNLSGSLSKEFSNLTNLENLLINGNTNLSGDLKTIFEGHNKIILMDIRDTSISPFTLDNSTSFKVLIYDLLNDNLDNTIDKLTQEDIDLLKYYVNELYMLKQPLISIEGNYWQVVYNEFNSQVILVEEITINNEIVDSLFSNETKTNVNDIVTQEDINTAKTAINNMNESAAKERLKNEIQTAQDILSAKDAVANLTDSDGIILEEITQEDINNSQNLVNKVPEGQLKDKLNDKLKEVQKQLDERDFVVLEEFKTFTGTGTVSTTIDAPVEKFSKVYVDGKLLPTSNYVVTSGSTVITLNESYLKILENGTYDVEVEFLSGAKISVPLTIDVNTITDPIDPVDPVDPTNPTNPTKPTDPTTPTNPIVAKPSIDGKPSVAGGTTVSGNNSVNTGDETNAMMLYAMLATSLLGLIVVIKRKKETE